MIQYAAGSGAKMMRKAKAGKAKKKAQKRAAAGTSPGLLTTGMSMLSQGGGRVLQRRPARFGGRRRKSKSIPMRTLTNFMLLKNVMGSAAMNKMAPILSIKLMRYMG